MLPIKSLIVAFVAICIYSVWLGKHKANFSGGQHQWQDNIIKSQRYIYEANSEKSKVIIGSSMSCRLDGRYLPHDFYNLSLGGQGIFDGLEVIKHKTPAPQQIYIEMNMVYREANREFSERLFSAGLFTLREHISVLQEQYQPVNYLVSTKLNSWGRGFIDPFVFRFINPVINKVADKKVSDDTGMKTQVINKLIAEYSQPFDSVLLASTFKNLQKQVKDAELKGAGIVFFEMPMQPDIENSVKALSVRRFFEKYFPAEKYAYLVHPAYKNYTTSDGVHLTEESAKQFTFYFTKVSKNTTQSKLHTCYR